MGDAQEVAVNWGHMTKLEREQAFPYCSLLTVHEGPAVSPNQTPTEAPLHLCEADQEESLTRLLNTPLVHGAGLPCPPGPAGHRGACLPAASNVVQPEEDGNLLFLMCTEFKRV